MKQLGIAILLMIALGVGVFILVSGVLIDEDFAGTVYERGIPLAIVGLFLLATPYVHQLLSGRRKRFSLTARPDHVARFGDYLLPWYILLAYGVLFLYAISGVAILLVWLAGEATGFYFTRLVSVFTLFFLMIGCFFIGSWIGMRAQRYPFLVSSGVVLGFMLFTVLLTFLEGSSPRLLSLVGAFVAYLFVISIGAWSGRRQRVSSYVQDLLTFVPPEKRLELADVVYQQAMALSPVEAPSTSEYSYSSKEAV
jgi:hypothetical protein